MVQNFALGEPMKNVGSSPMLRRARLCRKVGGIFTPLRRSILGQIFFTPDVFRHLIESLASWRQNYVLERVFQATKS